MESAQEIVANYLKGIELSKTDCKLPEMFAILS